jgi:hypothetical protein
MGKCEIIELSTKLFFRTPIKERRFYNEARISAIIKTSPRSPASELYHIPWCDTSYDPYPFLPILHQQYAQGK